MSAIQLKLQSAQLQLSCDEITEEVYKNIFSLLCNDMFVSPKVSLCDKEALTWLSTWRNLFEKRSTSCTSSAEVNEIAPEVIMRLKTCIENWNQFLVYAAQKVLVEIVKKLKSEEAVKLIHEILRMEKDTKIVTRYLEICCELLSKRNPYSYAFLKDICSGLKHVTQTLGSDFYESVPDDMMFEYVAVFFKATKLVSIHASEESINILQDTYFFDNNGKLLIDILSGTHIKKYVKRKLILALYYIVRPSSVLWRQKYPTSKICDNLGLEPLMVKFGDLYVERIAESGYSSIKDNDGKVTGFVDYVSCKGGNPEVDKVLLREWCVLSLGFSALLSRESAGASKLLHVIDKSVKEELDISETTLFPLLPAVFADQDDMWIDALFLLLDIGKSIGCDSLDLQHHLYFLQFVSAIAYDHLVLIDLLTSPETCFLEYLTAYLKYLTNTWPQFVDTVEAFKPHPSLEPHTMAISDIIDNTADIESSASNTIDGHKQSIDDENIDDESVSDDGELEHGININVSILPNRNHSEGNQKCFKTEIENKTIIISDNEVKCSETECLRDIESPVTHKDMEKNTKAFDISSEQSSGLSLLMSSYNDTESDEEMDSDHCNSEQFESETADNMCVKYKSETKVTVKPTEKLLIKGKQVLLHRTCLPFVNNISTGFVANEPNDNHSNDQEVSHIPISSISNTCISTYVTDAEKLDLTSSVSYIGTDASDIYADDQMGNTLEIQTSLTNSGTDLSNNTYNIPKVPDLKSNRLSVDEVKNEELEYSDNDYHERDKGSLDSDHIEDTENEDVVEQVMGMLIRVSLKLQRMWEHQIIAYNPKSLIRLLDNIEQLYLQRDKSE